MRSWPRLEGRELHSRTLTPTPLVEAGAVDVTTTARAELVVATDGGVAVVVAVAPGTEARAVAPGTEAKAEAPVGTTAEEEELAVMLTRDMMMRTLLLRSVSPLTRRPAALAPSQASTA